jgi:hypothetical protein
MPDVDDEFERRFERDYRSYLSANLPESNPLWTAETAMSREQRRSSALLPLASGVVAVGAVVALAGVLVLRVPSTAQTSSSPDGTPGASIASASPSPAPVATPAPSQRPSAPVIQPVFVETNIVDRPGVPAELRDRHWSALGQVGEVGTTARIALGPNELVIAQDAGLVASYAVLHNEEFGFGVPVVGPNGITVIVREVRTGAIRRTFDTPIVPDLGVMVGERLFWTGKAPGDGQDPDRDAIWGIDVGDDEAEPVQIAPPIEEQFGPDASGRAPLFVSDGGRVVISAVGGLDWIATQIIEVSTMSLRMTIDGEQGNALVGDRLLVHRGERRLGLFDVRTNSDVGRPLDVFIAQKTLAGDGEFFVQYGLDGEGVYFAAIDAATGESRILLHQPTGVRTSFLNDMSTPDLLVLDSSDWEFDSDGIPAARFSLLDPATGELTEDAFVIGSP